MPSSIFKRFATAASLVAAAFIFTAGCSDDDATSASCSFDSDCSLGTVCGADKSCVSAACDFCDYTAGQICYKTADNPDGSCSAPECFETADCADKGGSCVGGVCSDSACTTNADCGDNQVCNLAGACVESDGTCNDSIDCPSGQACVSNRCVEGCASNDDCEASEFCSTSDGICKTGCRDNSTCASNQVCATDSGRCVCTPTGCGEGKFCSTTSGLCEEATSCDQVMCPQGEVCNPAGLNCQAACTAESCGANEICNSQSGLCVPDTCPGEDPNQCAGTARPIWDPVRCYCVECAGDTDCNMAAGETCTDSGSCFACQTPCDANVPGTCGGATPYCFDECCLECIGAADCPQGELCLDGFCGQPPNCMVDASVCPAGTTCNMATGQCDTTPAGTACSAMDPTSCPSGQFCDPSTLTCIGAGGALGCGLCNADCTCDGGLNCNGFLCDGCSLNPINIMNPLQGTCPSGNICLEPLGGICFPAG